MTTQLPIPKEQLQKIIETADEIITVNDGTNEDISKNDTNKIIALYDHLNDDLAPPAVVKELARALLAAYEQEPVAKVVSKFGDPEAFGERELEVLVDIQKMPYNTPFFTRPAPSIPAAPDDTRRMDWLVSKTVNVREPLVYGSHDLFWSQTISDDWEEEHKTTLREQIDAAMLNGGKS